MRQGVRLAPYLPLGPPLSGPLEEVFTDGVSPFCMTSGQRKYVFGEIACYVFGSRRIVPASFVSPTKLEQRGGGEAQTLPGESDPLGLEALEAEFLGGSEAAGGISPEGSLSEESAGLPQEALRMVRAEVVR